MNSKQIIHLGIVFTVLVLAVCVKELQKPKELTVEEYAPLEFSFEPETIEKILLNKPGEKSIELIKENAQWRIPGLWNARADEKAIQKFLAEIRQAKGEVRSSDRALLKDFGLGDDQALSVSLFKKSEKPAVRFFVGGARAEAGFVFLKFENSDSVYLAQADLLTPMKVYGSLSEKKISAGAWAALNPFPIEASQVTRLELKRFEKGKENVTAALEAVKEGDKRNWQSLKKEAAFKVDSEKVEAFLFSLTNVQAAGILDPKTAGFEVPAWQMQLTLEGGREILVKAVPQENEGAGASYVMIQLSTEPVLFQISKHYFETLDIEDKQFAVAEPKPSDKPES